MSTVHTHNPYDPANLSASKSPVTLGDIPRLILAVLLPPVGVFFQVGFGLHFWLNILLTILGYIPGIIHAVWIIATRR